MKFSKYFMFAGFAALMASCASDAPIMNEGGMPSEVVENESYALLNLSLNESGTRAGSPADADTSNPYEYNVQTGAVLVFKKADASVTSEDSYTYVRSATVAANWKDETQKVDLNREAYVTVSFPKGTFLAEENEDAEFYAMIVLNPATGASGFKYPNAGQTFGAWRKIAQTCDFFLNMNNQKYMTFVSAPGTSSSTSKTFNVLRKIDKTAVKTNISELSTETALNFYVHRVPAKITTLLPSTNSDGVFTCEGGRSDGATITLQGWTVDVTAKSSYPVQNLTGLGYDDFDKLSTDAPHMFTNFTDFPSFRRANWAVTPNYDVATSSILALPIGDANYDNAHYTTTTSVPTDWSEAPVYVKENTMKATDQVEKRTTRVVIRAEFKLKDATTASTLILAGPTANEWKTKDEFMADVKDKAMVAIGETDETKVKVTPLMTTFPGKTYTLKQMCKIDNLKTSKEFTESEYNLVGERLGLTNATTANINLYKDGVCYYVVRLRHFDNSEVPLTDEAGVAYPNGVDATHPYLDKHLGRYGVLRNNWYELTINSVRNIGSPNIPDPDNDPDDQPVDQSEYLDFNIKMLNWSKRAQSADL